MTDRSGIGKAPVDIAIDSGEKVLRKGKRLIMSAEANAGRVVMTFSNSLNWASISPEDARHFARRLFDASDIAKKDPEYKKKVMEPNKQKIVYPH